MKMDADTKRRWDAYRAASKIKLTASHQAAFVAGFEAGRRPANIPPGHGTGADLMRMGR